MKVKRLRTLKAKKHRDQVLVWLETGQKPDRTMFSNESTNPASEHPQPRQLSAHSLLDPPRLSSNLFVLECKLGD